MVVRPGGAGNPLFRLEPVKDLRDGSPCHVQRTGQVTWADAGPLLNLAKNDPLGNRSLLRLQGSRKGAGDPIGNAAKPVAEVSIEGAFRRITFHGNYDSFCGNKMSTGVGELPAASALVDRRALAVRVRILLPANAVIRRAISSSSHQFLIQHRRPFLYSVVMHVQIVTFRLQGITDAQYIQACEQQFGPLFRDLPGLISKTWLRDPDRNTYGGVYLWKDKASMDAYIASDLFRAIGSHPNLADVQSNDYGVLEVLSAQAAQTVAAV